MKLLDININRHEEFSVMVISGKVDVRKGTECKIYENNDNLYFEDYEKSIHKIELNSDKDKNKLRKALQSPAIFWVMEQKKRVLQISSTIFTKKVDFNENVNFGITDKIFDDVKKRFLRTKSDNSNIETWFNKEFLIKSDLKGKYILISSGSPETISEKAFRVYGKSKAIDVKRNDEGKFEITKIITKSQTKPQYLGMLEAKFVDITNATVTRNIIQDQLREIDSHKRYVQLWKEYSEIENKLIFEDAKGIGNIRYTSYKEESNFFVFTLSKELKDKDIKKGDFFKTTEEQSEFSEDIFLSTASQTADFKGKLQKVVGKKIYLTQRDDDEGKPPNEGYISLSLVGDIVRINRRKEASDKIENANIPMPQISLILEGKELPAKPSKQIEGISPVVLEQFKGGKPNVIQEEAINIAINTPDIVLIQGPPGTGKTTVINAIVQRLVELCRKNGEDPKKSILLTSFQHDAVENVASGTNVMGIPTLKFGKQSETYKPFKNWQKDILENLNSKLYELGETPLEVRYKELRKKYISYINLPFGDAEIKETFNDIKSEFNNELSQGILNKIDYLLLKLGVQVPENYKASEFRKLLNSLRTEKIPYSDDGQRNIYRLLKHINKNSIKISMSDIDFLTELKNNDIEVSENQFDKLIEIKNKLIDNIVNSQEAPEQNFANTAVKNLFEKVLNELFEKTKNEGGISTIINELLEDIEADPERIKETIKQYTTVLASTVQQSVGKDVQNLFDDNIGFDTIIVDEAARTNPLDLFIPLTLAKKRIVLVGDHRQLPQILEPKVEGELSEIRDDDFHEALNKSLFERIFTSLKTQEKKDNIKRVITLNKQYRMHPEIGNFISKHFYEKYGDSELLTGVSKNDREHNIDKYKNKVADWIDIDNSNGKEQRRKGSYYRTSEAKQIVEEAKEILDKNTEYSVGIITFYSAQREEIFKAAKNKGMTFKNDEGDWEFTEKYSNLEIKDEQIRIGSVDAFQGKEFDIVLLSVVRSNNIKERDDEIRYRRRFGFLRLENRLNVAMSRAKRLIIAFGDKDTFNNEDAKEAVPGLYYFINELI